MKKGDTVTVTGYGRTKDWIQPDKPIYGVVTRKKGDSVFVVWEGTHFTEDEMNIKEVRKVKVGRKINVPDTPGVLLKYIEPKQDEKTE